MLALSKFILRVLLFELLEKECWRMLNTECPMVQDFKLMANISSQVLNFIFNVVFLLESEPRKKTLGRRARIAQRMRQQAPRCIILHVAVGPLIYWADNVCISGSVKSRLWQASKSMKVSSSFRLFASGGFMEVWISYEYAILWHYDIPPGFSSFLSLKAMAFDGVIVLLSVVDLVNDFASGAGLEKWIKHEATELSLIFFANLREGDSIRFHEIRRASDVSGNKRQMWKQNAVKAFWDLCSDGGGSAITALRACWT